MPSRVCPSCSTVSDTDKSFCPECGASYGRSPSGSAIEGSSTGSSTLKTLAIVGLVSYALACFLPMFFFDFYSFGESVKRFIGFSAISNPGTYFENGYLMYPIMGYIFAAILIVSSKKN